MTLRPDHNGGNGEYVDRSFEADGPGYGEPTSDEILAAERWATAMSVMDEIIAGADLIDAITTIAAAGDQTETAIKDAVRSELTNILAQL